MTCAGLKGRCFLELKSVLLEVGYIKKWPKFAYLESKVPHLKFRVYAGPSVCFKMAYEYCSHQAKYTCHVGKC